MGFLKGLAGVFGALFSSPAAIGAIVETVTSKSNTKDMTPDERAAFNQQVTDSTVRLMEASEGSSVSRRLIVQIVFAMWALGTVIMFAAIGFEAGFAPALAEYMNANVTPLMFVIASFYFGKQVVDAVGRSTERAKKARVAAHAIRDVGRKLRGK